MIHHVKRQHLITFTQASQTCREMGNHFEAILPTSREIILVLKLRFVAGSLAVGISVYE